MSLADAVRPFADAVSRSHDRLAALADSGQPLLGYFCTYTPVELIHACGFVPVRVSGGPGSVERAYGLAPDFVCPFMKRALENALEGRYRFLSGLVQGYTCDVACGMVNIWAENIRGELFHSIPIPYNDSAESRKYFGAEIERFVKKAEDAGGRFTFESLDASLDLYARIRNRLRALFDQRAGNRLPLSAADLHVVVQAGTVSAPEEYEKMLAELEARLEPAQAAVANAGLPVLVSGSLVENSGVLADMEAMGARIAADDLCTGYRLIEPVDGRHGCDPMERLTDRYLNRFPCPSRSRAEQRLPLLVQLAKKAAAKGVVFLLQKFCTPHLADIPPLTAGLKAKGLPALVIEMDESWRLDGQQRTRLEGFLEMLD